MNSQIDSGISDQCGVEKQPWPRLRETPPKYQKEKCGNTEEIGSMRTHKPVLTATVIIDRVNLISDLEISRGAIPFKPLLENFHRSAITDGDDNGNSQKSE